MKKRLLTVGAFVETAIAAGIDRANAAWARRVILDHGLGRKIAGRYFADADRVDRFLSLDGDVDAPSTAGSPGRDVGSGGKPVFGAQCSKAA